MPSALTPKQRRLFLSALVFILPVSALLIFALPWHVPVRGPIESESYTFGFSNVTAHLGVALTLAALFGVRLLIPQLASQDRDVMSRFIVTPDRFSAPVRTTLLACIILTLLVVGGWWYVLPFGYFGESTYFLTRLDMMSLGQVPFRDFGFHYGLAMLWIPYFLHQASLGLLAMDTAYILTVLLFFAAGILAVGHILRCLNLQDHVRVLLIIFTSLATLNIMLGVMYTALRFIYPVWAVLVLFEVLKSSSKRKAWISAFLLAFFGLFISPDSGLVTCLAFIAGFLRLWKTGDSRAPLLLSSVVAALVACMCLFSFDYFNMILSFGGGAGNFPIFPAPYILALLLSAFFVLPQIASAGWSGGAGIAPVSISLLFALGLFLPAALGRCDPGHVLFNGLGILLFVLALAVFLKSRSMMLVTGASAMIALATMEISFWSHYDGLVENALKTREAIAANQSQVQVAEWLVQSRLAEDHVSNRFDWQKRMPFSPDLLELLRYNAIATPVGVAEDIDRFLKVSGRYVPEYFVPPFAGAFTPKAVEKQSELLKNSEILLVPQSLMVGHGKVDRVAYANSWSRFMSGLFFFPVSLKVVNEPFIPDAEVIQKLLPHFTVEGQFRDYLILRHN
jgi:hypothetical protein